MIERKKSEQVIACVCVCVCVCVCDDYFNSDRESLLDIVLIKRLNIEKISA